jgi:polysaccharide export outer membrane protein
MLGGLCQAQSSKKNKQLAKNTNTAATATSAAKSDYIIGTDDVLNVSVWKEPDLSRAVTVRPDGKITMPLIGDVTAGGLTTQQLQQNLNQGLQNYVSDPAVTVSVQESRSQKFNIVGQVQKPGAYIITTPVTVLDAISMAGGFREWAKEKKIYVLRTGPDGREQRLAFNYKNVIKGHHIEQNIQIQPKDTVVVP